MGIRKHLRKISELLSKFYGNQRKINLNDEDVRVTNMGWVTKQWDDGTGKLNKMQQRLGGKDNFRLGYRYKKLD